MKVLIFLCFLAAAKAGVIGPVYAPAPAVYPSAPVVKTFAPATYTQTLGPAPVYESVLTTHQTRTNALDGSQQDTFSKTLNTPYSSIQKFDSRTNNAGLVANTVPVYSNVLSHPQATFNVAPAVHHVGSPVAYTTRTGPVVTKTVSPGLTTYASHTPVVAQPAVKIHYSEAPLVSHMTFTGLGTHYSW
ncbi:hypothetical protein NE865_11013 [Phthorimaea operculella]|nr:hypothetical protein NE865_11013 [Phthorimaea operculella]